MTVCGVGVRGDVGFRSGLVVFFCEGSEIECLGFVRFCYGYSVLLRR